MPMGRVVAALAYVALLSAAPPAAAQSRTTLGWVSVLAGSGLVAAAFDYQGDTCPEGYSTHTFEHEPTQCLFVSPHPPFDTDTRDATTDVTFKRPALLWAGVGALGAGALLLLLPDNGVTRGLDVQIAPERVAVRRAFGW